MKRTLFGPLITLAMLSAACSTDLPTGGSPPEPPIVQGILASIGSTPCPPTIPAGYTLVFCFDFTTIPGVWHGFIVGTSMPPTTSGGLGQLSADYLLLSPTGLNRLPPGGMVDVSQPTYTFQSEFNGVTWLDVVRVLTPGTEAAHEVTMAVVQRALTPAIQAEAIITQISDLGSAGVLNTGQAVSLTAKLKNTLRLIGAGKNQAAAQVLGAFVQHVRDLMAGPTPVLSSAQGSALIAAAEALITRLVEPIPAAFSGVWSGSYSFGSMSAVLEQTGSVVTGEITDALSCV